jgi:glycerol-3-phosphate dehydrogenase
MAVDAVDAAEEQLAGRHRRSRTKRLRLLGADGYREPRGDDTSAHLLRRYGSEATAIETLIASDPSLAEPLVAGLPYVRAEAVHAARHEMATTLDDVLSRRTRARLLDRHATAAAAPHVARLLAQDLGWDDAAVDAHVVAFQALLDHEDTSSRLPEDALDASFGA